MSLKSFRERVNIRLYNSKKSVLSGLNTASIIVSLIAIGSLLYYHGFPISEQTRFLLTSIIKVSFAFYILKYITGFVYSFKPREYLKSTRFEGILMLLIVIDFISDTIFHFPFIKWVGIQLGMDALKAFYILFMQLYILIIVGVEIGKASTQLPILKRSPPTLLMFSFIILIIIGTGLLMLPEMTSSGIGMPFIKALFTSISASCVTGLTVVDTATYFSFKGQLLIMLLIQLGGLNIISFATFFAIFSRRGIGIKHQSIIQESLSSDSLMSSKGMLRQIFLFSFLIELAGSILIFFSWSSQVPFKNIGDQLFHSIFHAISAFNNAGFSLFSNGLTEYYVSNSYFLHIVIAVLILMGGIGFPVLRDLFNIHRVRERKSKPWKQYKISTRVTLYSSALLLIAGMLVFLLTEWNNSMEEKNVFEKLITSLFQSVTARTAGFSTVDFSVVSLPALLFFIFLMFIGASPGSTGGGIKTSTFTLILLSAYSTIRGKKNLELFKHTFSFELLNKAFSILLFSAGFIFASTFVLLLTDRELGMMPLLFEEVSAFATVGLSTGITSELSTAGKTVLMISMYVGRVGTLTLAFALGRKKESTDYKYPKAPLLVG